MLPAQTAWNPPVPLLPAHLEITHTRQCALVYNRTLPSVPSAHNNLSLHGQIRLQTARAQIYQNMRHLLPVFQCNPHAPAGSHDLDAVRFPGSFPHDGSAHLQDCPCDACQYKYGSSFQETDRNRRR